MKPRKTLNSAPTAIKKPFITLGDPGYELLNNVLPALISAAVLFLIYDFCCGGLLFSHSSHSSQPDPNSYTASEQRISQKQEIDKAAKQSAAEWKEARRRNSTTDRY